jgi:hypothetical protein
MRAVQARKMPRVGEMGFSRENGPTRNKEARSREQPALLIVFSSWKFSLNLQEEKKQR